MSETTELRPILKAFAKRAGDYIAAADEHAPEKCRGWWCGYSAPEKAAHAAHTAATLAELVIMGIEDEEAGVADKLDRIAGTLVLLRHDLIPLVRGGSPEPHALAEAFAGAVEAKFRELELGGRPEASSQDACATLLSHIASLLAGIVNDDTSDGEHWEYVDTIGCICVAAYQVFGILEEDA